MGEELLQQPEKTEQPQDAGNGVPQNQNSASLTQEQREADKRLLDIIDKRLDAMSAVQTRANAYMVALCLLVIIQTATLIGFGVWTGFTTYWTQSAIEKHEAAVMAKVEKMEAELASAGTESRECMERVRKYVWELKTALGLKFSQQRGAQQQAEDGEE